jgi:hypothetical protein
MPAATTKRKVNKKVTVRTTKRMMQTCPSVSGLHRRRRTEPSLGAPSKIVGLSSRRYVVVQTDSNKTVIREEKSKIADMVTLRADEAECD